jgi:hypothetical protein
MTLIQEIYKIGFLENEEKKIRTQKEEKRLPKITVSDPHFESLLIPILTKFSWFNLITSTLITFLIPPADETIV